MKKLRIKKTYDNITSFLLSSKNPKIVNLILIMLITFFYVLRGYRYILHPQLFAEDGTIWIGNAYDKGLHTIFQPYNGLSHLFERLFGLFSIHIIPLQYEPLLYTISALLIFLLLCRYILSDRTRLFSSNYQKIFFGLSMCLLGNAEEFYFSFSNSVFLLGLVGLFILVINKSEHKFINILEKMLFFILCFTITFSWLYILIIAFEFIWKRKRKYYYLVCALAGSITEFLIYIFHSTQRPNIPIRYILSKATIFEFYNQMIIPSLRFGRQDISPLTGNTTNLIVVTITLLIVTTIIAFIFVKSNYVTRCLLFFCLMMTIVSLRSPIDGQTIPSLIVITMATYHWGNRYFIYGIIGLFVVWAKFSQRLIRERWLAMFLVIFFGFAVLSSITLGSFFIQKYFVNLSTQYSNGITEVKRNDKKLVVIPINPAGWSITLDLK
ncbi:MAG TPA: hypothetical protein VII94_00140 [Candidatus Saccharimonadales bacterium]